MKAGDIISKTHEIAGEAPISLEAKVNWVVDEEMGVDFLSPPDWRGR